MEASQKRILKVLSLELRHLLEGRYDAAGKWHPGDLEQRLAAIGVRRDRDPAPVDELTHLTQVDRAARKVVDGYLNLRKEAGIDRAEAVGEFVRETAYTWANRLLALRCMEARELIDEVILQKDTYGGRSLEHHRLAKRQPELCAGEDDGLLAVLDQVSAKQAVHLPLLFDAQAPGVALKPSPAALKRCIVLLSEAPGEVFQAADAFGWAYQYWNTEEKDRVFEKVRTVKGAKIAGADIVPATQLYTESYMVKFLVQNSLGATWMGIHPESRLFEGWEYYVRDADRAPVTKKPVREITFLDPACGSGHFLLEAFDLFFAIYQEEGELTEPAEICDAILTRNLFGIDIDSRAVQIAEVALWMKAAEKALDYTGVPANLVAATASHLKGKLWEDFLADFQREPSIARVLRRFAQTMEHIDEIGSLARPAEDLREIIKEEHAIWERQVHEREEANYLFPEMRDAAFDGQLLFHEISDEEFGERLFYRTRASINAFTLKAREEGQFQDQTLGRETQAEFRFLEVLSRQYDVVAANPPYMGSRNMPASLKTFVFSKYPDTKLDLYQAFLSRAFELTLKAGRFALVTPQSWLKHRTLETLRLTLLSATLIEVCAHLGNAAFSEIGGAVVSTTLAVFAKVPLPRATSSFARLVDEPAGSEKANGLRLWAKGGGQRTTRINQSAFLAIPRSPILYELPESMIKLFSGPLVRDHARVAAGLQTSDNVRFIRFDWEIPNSPESRRWVPYEKAGGYCRWFGLQHYRVDWEHHGIRVKEFITKLYDGAHWSKNVRNIDKYFTTGLTYSDVSGFNLGIRLMEKGQIWDICAPAVFPKLNGESLALMAVLNSRLVTFFLRRVTSGAMHVSGLERIPLTIPDGASKLGALALAIKKRIIQGNPIERHYHVRCNGSLANDGFRLSALILFIEAVIDYQASNAYGISESSQLHVQNEVGKAAGSYPLVKGYDSLPSLSDENEPNSISQAILEVFATHRRRELVTSELEGLKSHLQALYVAGRGSEPEEEPRHNILVGEEEDEETGGALIPIPAETFLEELSQELEVHPVSIYWLLKEGIEKEGWRCLPEERRLWADRITVTVLRLLGHRWGKQIEAGEPVPAWAAQGGIIPLTSLVGEATVFERIQKRLQDDDFDANGFVEVMEKSLDTWLATEFFKHHTKQFKRRPIAWQLQSGKFTTRKTPAFACLLYYHKLDGSTLAILQSQCVRPLRQRLETEARGIQSIPAAARTERQEKRRLELEELVRELGNFDGSLEQVALSGFGPASLVPRLRQYAVDDAMLSLKTSWLKRLGQTVEAGPLLGWQQQAAALHPELAGWIGNAMTSLDHFCAHVPPRAPDQSQFQHDPTSELLAELIDHQTRVIVEKALELASNVWWKQLDAALFAPIREQIKTCNEEMASLTEEMKGNLEENERRVAARRLKELRAQKKEWEKELRAKTAQAQKLREQIESWTCPEAETWQQWLAAQPLFDTVTSLDGQRPPPKSVAEFIAQESRYVPDVNDGVRVNIAPLQKAGLLADEVLAKKDVDKAIADRAEWRADERRWVREGKLPKPGWWPENGDVV